VQRERRGDAPAQAAAGGQATVTAPAPGLERRRASRALWAACEALLSATVDPRALNRALDALQRAFECEGVALHALGPSGVIEPWSARGAWQTTAGDLRACVSVPLFRGHEQVGSLDLLGRAGQRWSAAQLGLVRTASGALGSALGACFELKKLREQPGRDPVTGLPDARAFGTRLTEELARARRHGMPLAIVSIDLDHFAALNQRFGRTVGDEVLAEVALVLKLTLRESDYLARLGGDGFVVLLPEADAAPARRCAERVCRALEEHHFPRVSRLTASAGVATSPRDGVEALELMNAMDQALSIAKKSGRRRVAMTETGHTH
jgi:diguanylate cyclase (GGDEF)-like protein